MLSSVRPFNGIPLMIVVSILLPFPLHSFSRVQHFNHHHSPTSYSSAITAKPSINDYNDVNDDTESSLSTTKNSSPRHLSIDFSSSTNRASFLINSFLTTAAATTALTTTPSIAIATTTTTTTTSNIKKQTNLSNADIAAIVRSDLVDKQFLCTADLTRSIYDESATFTDEIDTYAIDAFIKGTSKLFVKDGSKVDLLDNEILSSKEEVSFRFREDLMFNVPILRPVVSLSGKVVLTRDDTTGLIVKYREYWDQSVNQVLSTAKFFQ